MHECIRAVPLPAGARCLPTQRLFTCTRDGTAKAGLVPPLVVCGHRQVLGKDYFENKNYCSVLSISINRILLSLIATLNWYIQVLAVYQGESMDMRESPSRWIPGRVHQWIPGRVHRAFSDGLPRGKKEHKMHNSMCCLTCLLFVCDRDCQSDSSYRRCTGKKPEPINFVTNFLKIVSSVTAGIMRIHQNSIRIHLSVCFDFLLLIRIKFDDRL